MENESKHTNSKQTNGDGDVLDTNAVVGWVILTTENVEIAADADHVAVYPLTVMGHSVLMATGELPSTPPVGHPANRGAVRFPLGFVVATPGALAVLAVARQQPAEFLARHQAGDWGELCAEDRRENELALQRGFRLLSSYRLADGEKLWVITDGDRGATTLLLPEEY